MSRSITLAVDVEVDVTAVLGGIDVGMGAR